MEDHIFRSGQGKVGGNAKGKRTSTTMRAVVEGGGGRGGGAGLSPSPPCGPEDRRESVPLGLFFLLQVYNKQRGNVLTDIHTVRKSPKFKLSALLNMNIL